MKQMMQTLRAYYKEMKEEYGAGEEGTTKLKNKYMKDTFSKMKKFKNYIK